MNSENPDNNLAAQKISKPIDAIDASKIGDFSKPIIVIGRHGKSILSRKIFLSARQYIDWWAKYDESGLAKNQKIPRKTLNIIAKCNKIISSSLLRAIETARHVAGDREFVIDKDFVEAPLPPPLLPEFMKFRPRIWGFLARCSWYIGFSGGQESRFEAENRAILCAQKLIKIAREEGSVALLAHGWFNRMLRPNLEKNGWVCIYDGGDFHWSYRVYQLQN